MRRPQSYRSKTKRPWKGNRVSSIGDTRIIKFGNNNGSTVYPENKITSSKYTVWTFIPKNLYEQFRRIANFYFLCMAIIAFAIASPVSPLTSLLPLIFVVVVTGIKQAYEDYLRHRADREVNNFAVTVIRGQSEETIPAKKIKVGDVVKINDEQDIPCDLVLLVSSHKESKCFVTTANLDGETNLKTLYCPKSLKRFATSEDLHNLEATIECESPTADLYKFYGRLEYGKATSKNLRKSMIKREQSIRKSKMAPQCCYLECENCDFKKPADDSEGGTESSDEFRMESLSCYCQCRTRGVPPVLSSDVRESVLPEAQEMRHSDGVPSSNMNGPEPIKSVLRKTHKKTDSNVSRVSFNVTNLRRDSSDSSNTHREWTLERKTSILSRRNSSLLSSRRPSIATTDGCIADPLGAENLLLRGARLKNTSYVYGCAVYTGQDSKLALNSKLTSNKFSTVERSVNKFLMFYLAFLIIEVVVSTVLKILRESKIGFKAASEKRFKVKLLEEPENLTALGVVEDFFSFVVLYNYVIPISLYVTMEMQKFLGTLFFEWDLNMYDETNDETAICNTSDLNEDLGQIEYLFTDKTGTLTENCMLFRQCSIEGEPYIEQSGALYPVLPGEEKSAPVDLRNCSVSMERFLLALSLCHTVQVEEKLESVGEENDVITFSAASPDEKALVEAMQRLDLVFTNDEDDLIVLKIFNEEKFFKRLEVLEFTSDRKRMSVIIQEEEEDKLYLFCKGAESSIMPLVTDGEKDKTLQHVADFASRGLRTLVVGCKQLSNEDFEKMTWEIQNARKTLSSNRDVVVAKAYERAEYGLTILGATGVEDKLQDGVEETLDGLRNAGVKVWILTGDKVETAMNISMSCGHFKAGTVPLQLVGYKTSNSCAESLQQYSKKIDSDIGENFGLVVDGESLTVALEDHKELFREVCMKCTAVICCRMSPLQKSKVVKLVKTSKDKPVTAAVGDGANDVSMIQEAHVGLGIMGKEGRQAVRCADFAFGRFKFLREALLVHGHWYYIRVATLVQYFFYKNIVFILPQFYFLFYNGYSTNPIYDSMYLTCFNVIFTSLPIVFYGLFEQNYSAEQLRQQPDLYSINSRNCLMTWRHFLKWFFLGTWHSLVIFFLPLMWFWLNSNVMQRGLDSYLELFGTQVFHSSVVVVSLKLWIHSRFWCVPFIGSLVFSVGIWIILGCLYSIVDLVETAPIYYTFLHMMASPNMWLISLLSAAACLIPDIVIDALQNQFQNNFQKTSVSPWMCFTKLSKKASTVYDTRI